MAADEIGMRGPRGTDMRLREARMLLKDDLWDEAVSACESLVEDYPRCADAYVVMGDACYMLGRYR